MEENQEAHSSELLDVPTAKMPHIQLPENLGIHYAVLPGDPARAERAAGYLKDAKLLAWNREYKSYSGFWNGVPILIMSTGMGGPSMAIAVEELRKIGVTAAIRIGSCGALQPEAGVGDLVMVEAAVRDEGTSLGYAPLSYPAVADHRLLTACEESASEAGYRFHTGIARSHDCLYRDDNPAIYADWAKKGVMASDMETAALFVVGRIRGMKTASILNVVAACKGNVAENIGRYVDGETLTAQGEEHEILTAFAALAKLDA
ncbi:nucleoside phosphorylase [Clostridium sp. AF32-12BH]|uniref:nucleoside phosphorylase n=1 Tax=Clostridium sp. AF32-12BH TaxID=2292006 RepID=UPI00268E5B7E